MQPFVITVPDDPLFIDPILPGLLQLELSMNLQGPPGSQELKVIETNASGAVEIDYALGSWQTLVLVGNVTSLTVKNWPPAGKAARLVLHVKNTGSFNLVWPVGTLWPLGGDAPIVTSGAGKQDLYVLSTGSGGAPIFGAVGGQDFA